MHQSSQVSVESFRNQYLAELRVETLSNLDVGSIEIGSLSPLVW